MRQFLSLGKRDSQLCFIVFVNRIIDTAKTKKRNNKICFPRCKCLISFLELRIARRLTNKLNGNQKLMSVFFHLRVRVSLCTLKSFHFFILSSSFSVVDSRIFL